MKLSHLKTTKNACLMVIDNSNRYFTEYFFLPDYGNNNKRHDFFAAKILQYKLKQKQLT